MRGCKWQRHSLSKRQPRCKRPGEKPIPWALPAWRRSKASAAEANWAFSWPCCRDYQVVVLRGWPSHTSILQHAREDVVVDVAAGDDEAHAFSLQRRFFFQSGGQSRGSSAFHHVVSVGEVDFHGLRDFLFAHLQHVVDIFENDFERGVIGESAGHAVAQQGGGGGGRRGV